MFIGQPNFLLQGGSVNAASIHIASSMRSRIRGLLGLRAYDGLLLLVPCRDIHTFGMKFCIDVAFVDANGRVLTTQKRVPPGKRLRCKHAVAVLERQSAEGVPWFKEGSLLALGTQD